MANTPVFSFFLTLATSFFLLMAILWFAARRPDYSHCRNTISELGEFGSPAQHIVSYGVFLPVGVMLLVIAFLSKDATPNGAVLSLCLAIGYVAAAFFPCDRGSPLYGSVSQFIHNCVGGIEYLGGSIALWQLGWVDDSHLFRALAVCVGVATVALVVPAFWGVRGLVQRVTELGLFAGLAAAIWMS